MDKIDSPGAIVLGCLVGVVSSAAQSVGLTLQRKSHIIEDAKPSEVQRRPAHRRGMWQMGVMLFIAANVFGSSVQITTLPLIILSPLQAIGLVFNSICASLILAEPFTQSSLIGTVLVSAGALLIAANGAVTDPHHNLDELLVLLQRPQFLTWMACTLIVVAAILVALSQDTVHKLAQRAVERRLSEGQVDPAANMPVAAFILSNSPLVSGAMYGTVSGILSAHSLLMAKSAVEILVRGVKDRWHDYLRWQAWSIVGLFLAFALLQLYYLNCGLRLCSTSVLYPLVFCIYNITTILNGLIYFQQTQRLSYWGILLVALGTVLVLVGVFFLSWRLNHPPSSASPHYPRTPSRRSVSGTSLPHPITPTTPTVGAVDTSASERTPLLHYSRGAPRYLSPQEHTSPRSITDSPERQEYTSFRNLAAGISIPEPGSPYSGRRNVRRSRSLSQEQCEVLDQLRKK